MKQKAEFPPFFLFCFIDAKWAFLPFVFRVYAKMKPTNESGEFYHEQ